MSETTRVEMGGTFRLALPIVKVDPEKRRVSGIASEEVIDKDGEIVDYASLKDALVRTWPGNLREMHQPIAAGKAVSIEFDDANKRVLLDSAVSRGAESTWQKILDRVLTGYSIGGSTSKRVTEVVNGKPVTRLFIDQIAEISYVDNPACPTAAFSIVKSVDGEWRESPDSQGVSDMADELKTTQAETPAEPVAKNAPEPWDIADATDLIAGLNRLMAAEMFGAREASAAGDPALAAVELSQVQLLKLSIEYLIAFLQSEFAEQFANNEGSAAAEGEGVERAAQAGDAQKRGARNSKSDMARIQKMHDVALELGAACSKESEKRADSEVAKAVQPPTAPALEPSTEPPPAPIPAVAIEDSPIVKALQSELVKAAGMATQANQTLEEQKATIAAQAGLLVMLEERLAKVESQPAPGGPVLRAVAVEKSLGGSAPTLSTVPASDGSGDQVLDAFATLAKAATSEQERLALATQKQSYLIRRQSR